MTRREWSRMMQEQLDEARERELRELRGNGGMTALGQVTAILIAGGILMFIISLLSMVLR